MLKLHKKSVKFLCNFVKKSFDILKQRGMIVTDKNQVYISDVRTAYADDRSLKVNLIILYK